MTQPKIMKNPAQYLLETGLLFEINRQVLHPYGLALGLNANDPEGEKGTFVILDERDDKEGFVFSPELFVSGVQKTNKFIEEFGAKKLVERNEELGYVVQDTPEAYMKKDGIILLTYNPSYDADEEDSMDLVGFRVPFAWLEKEARDWFNLSIPEFLEEYTYDTTEPLYAKAKRDGVIINENFFKDTV